MNARALLVLLAAATLHAEQHMVEYLLPRGGSRGASVDVAISGQYLQDPKEIVFYSPGIKATNIKPGAKPATEVKATFEIAPDCAPGEHILRLRTATALSEAITFWVSKFPTVNETEKKVGDNDTIAKAQPVPLNSTVNGEIQSGNGADRDMYRVDVEQGQRISVEVEAVRLGTMHIGGDTDMAVRILDAQGKELGKSDDSALFVQDPVLSITAPKKGSYYVEIAQQLFSPPRLAFYRAHIGTFTRPMAIFPAGGQTGEQLNVKVLGDPAGERTETVALPKQAGDFAFYSQDAPSPNMLRVVSYPNVMEGDLRIAQTPVAMNGIISQPGEVDRFYFWGKKGETYKIRVYGRTLGSPIDPKIWIRASNSTKNTLEADDSKLADLGYVSARGSWFVKDMLDPVTLFKPGADGDYILGVEESRGKGGKDFVYRVEVEQAKDTIYTHISNADGYQIPRQVGLIIPQGNQWTVDVQLAQGFGNNYKGEVELEAVGLPRGVTMIAPKYPKGAMRMPVQFVAEQGAEQQAAFIELRAKAVDPKVQLQTGSRQGAALVNKGNQLAWHFLWMEKFAMAVTQPAPFHIELEQPEIPLAQNGELELKVKLIRHGDFNDPVEIQTDWLPQGVSKQSAFTIPKDKNEATFKINAGAKAPAGVFKIAMNATTAKGGDSFSGVGRVRVSSKFVELTISQPYLAVDLKRASVEKGQRGQIVGTLKQNKPFPGVATAVLKRLPKGIKMVEPAPQITAKDQQVVFQIEADSDALTGLYKEIFCEVTVKENNQTVRQQTGSGILRIDPARTTAAAAR
jgi:hypothetical protein